VRMYVIPLSSSIGVWESWISYPTASATEVVNRPGN
jgi:hypothetical protein